MRDFSASEKIVIAVDELTIAGSSVYEIICLSWFGHNSYTWV
jgi:hypothetical protein